MTRAQPAQWAGKIEMVYVVSIHEHAGLEGQYLFLPTANIGDYIRRKEGRGCIVYKQAELIYAHTRREHDPLRIAPFGIQQSYFLDRKEHTDFVVILITSHTHQK